MPPVAILAGGLATRLRPITEKIPKALVEISGSPFVKLQLGLLKRNGIERIVLCVGYLGDMIYEVIGNGSALGLHVDYSYDGPVLLGTGGSLKKALPLLGDAFFVLYGDSYLVCDYQDIQRAFEKSGKSALMTVFKNDNRWDKSNIFYQNGKIYKYDKNEITPEMHHIDYGLSILKKEAFDTFPEKDVFDLADLYKFLISREEMAGYEVKNRFYEIGSREGIEETKKYIERMTGQNK